MGGGLSATSLRGYIILGKAVGVIMKYFIPYVFAYLIKKASFWLFNYHPFQEYSFFLALIIDLSIWMILCFLFVFLYNKIFKPKLA